MSQLPAEYILAIQTVVKREIDSIMTEKVKSSVTIEIDKLNSKILKEAHDTVSKKMESVTDNEISAALKSQLDSHTAYLSRRVKAIEDRQVDLLQFRMPEYYHKSIMDLQEGVIEMKASLSSLDKKMTNIMLGKFVENPSDEELKDLYKKSGIALKVIAEHFKVETSRAHQMVNGKIKNPSDRARLRQLMFKALEAKLEAA